MAPSSNEFTHMLEFPDRQGLTLVHFSAQPKSFWSHLPVSHCPIDWGEIIHPTYPTKCAYVEPKSGRVRAPAYSAFRAVVNPNVDTLYSYAWLDVGRGLHSFPSPLHLSLLCPFPLN